MAAPKKSKMGLGFLTGFLGAYIFSVVFVRLGGAIGLDTALSVTNAGYLMNIAAGLFTGFLTVYISKERRLRILLYVFGSLMVMDHIAFFSTAMPLADMIDRMMVDFSLLISGLITYKILPESEVTDPA